MDSYDAITADFEYVLQRDTGRTIDQLLAEMDERSDYEGAYEHFCDVIESIDNDLDWIELFMGFNEVQAHDEPAYHLAVAPTGVLPDIETE